MKKLIALLMAAVMALSLAGCAAKDKDSSAAETSATESTAESAEESKAEESVEESAEESVEDTAKLAAGTYYLVGMYQNDEMMGTDTIRTMANFGVVSDLVLNEDGTGSMTTFGNVVQLTWDEKGLVAEDDPENPIEYEIADDLLTLYRTADNGTTEIIFSTMTAAELIEAGKGIAGTGQYAPKNPDSVADGDIYHLITMSQGENVIGTDQIIQMESYGMGTSLQLNTDGTGTLMMYGVPVELNWEGDALYIDEGEEIPFERVDDTIVLKNEDATLVFSLRSAQELEDAGEGIPSAGDYANMGQHEDPEITLAGADWIENPDEPDEYVLLVWVDVDNTTSEAFTPAWRAVPVLTQDNVQVEEFWYYGEENDPNTALYEESRRAIMPEGKNRVGYFFAADPTGGMMHLTIQDGWYEETIYIDEDLDPANLPGEPAEALVVEPVSEYPELADAPKVASYDDFEVEILAVSFEEPEDEYDVKTIKVELEFRNNSKETTRFWSETSYSAFQDRLGLLEDYMENEFEDVPAGGKIVVTLEWKLYSDSPVAFRIVDNWDDLLVGGVYPVE